MNQHLIKLLKILLVTLSILSALLVAFLSQASSIDYLMLLAKMVVPVYILHLVLALICIKKTFGIHRKFGIVSILIATMFMGEISIRVLMNP
jgi:hypothetical protein